MDRGNKLFYVIWHHATETRICTDDFELKSLFLSKLIRILVLEFPAIEAAAKLAPLTKLNSKYGHSDNPTYGAGRRIPVKRLMKAEHLEIPFHYNRELF